MVTSARHDSDATTLMNPRSTTIALTCKIRHNKMAVHKEISRNERNTQKCRHHIMSIIAMKWIPLLNVPYPHQESIYRNIYLKATKVQAEQPERKF